MGTLAPREIEQCVGCSIDVAVYSDRQRLGSDVLCSSCRRIRTRADRSAARARSGKPAPGPNRCTCATPIPEPTCPGECRTCWYQIATAS